ncbi:DUF349 domain-containing protein [Marivirga harenae]|uniref:DUF349 domain-containing protein n=1 Tax=Marivirga harenae TaxID=2010992 RepID=UPI0026DF7018|nr:DUF349 domain-containing protein [Marivirga harenae]WKV11524.1 DUF349 domain-containing protein [Marivirga harenae]
MIDEKGTSENPKENNSELGQEKEHVEATSENKLEDSAQVEKGHDIESEIPAEENQLKEEASSEADQKKDGNSAEGSEKNELQVEVQDQKDNSESTEDEKQEEDDDEHDDHEELPDYSEFNKEQLVEAIKEVSKSDNFKKADRIINEIKPIFDEIYEAERKEALDKFLADGGEEGDFAMKHDELNDRFEANYQLYRDRRKKHFRELENQKDENLKTKQEILDRLRELVDGEETITSLNVIKDLQKEWKSVGPVPGNQSKTLWANYNALLDRYYDQRSILFELKELDRKKNLQAKVELCVKAEELAQSEDVPYAIKHLNDLHEEYKHIGPVPKEEQEPLWQRFKAASDAIYEKRKEFVKNLKEIQTENLEKKEVIIEKLKPYLDFNSDRIKEWNAKTKEILAIQKEWEATGQVPKENAKEINKSFWGNFKQFFANKHEFFKRLDSMREENLKKKQEFVEKAKELSESTEWNKTADQLKGLQRQWKDVGPVPEKFRESIYKEFKSACDKFFENKRAGSKDAQKEFEANLKAKEDIISQINQLEPGDLDQLEAYEQAYGKIGFVPKEAIQKVKEDFSTAVQNFIDKSEDVLSDEQREKVKLMAQITKIMSGPNSDRKLNQKENSIRKKIGDLQNDIVTWKNNMEFFASSKTADKVKQEFEIKIEEAEKEISLLKKQLRIVRSID